VLPRGKALWVAMLIAASMLATPVGAPERACTLLLMNSDRVRGRVVDLTGGVLRFRPDVAAETTLSLSLDRIVQVSFTAPAQCAPPEEGVETLLLRDGSVLHGKFVELTERSLLFDLGEVGLLGFPVEAVDELSRTDASGAAPAVSKPAPPAAQGPRVTLGPPRRRGRFVPVGGDRFVPIDGFIVPQQSAVSAQPNPPEPSRQLVRPDCHTLVTTRGDVLLGDLRQDDGLLLVTGGAVEASVPIGALASIRFPRVADGAATGEGTVTASLATGDRLVGTEPQIADGRFSLTLVGENRVSFPLEGLTELLVRPSRGLIGHWTFDNTDGGAARDSSGRGNDGRVHGAQKVAGVLGGAALYFDGRSSYVEIPDSPSLTVTSEMTVAFWLKPMGAGSTDAFLISKFVHANRSRADDSFCIRGPGPSFRAQLNGGETSATAGASSLREDGRWHHVAFVFDRPTGRLFLDGASAPGLRPLTLDHDVNNTATPLYLGAGFENGALGRFFRGMIDDVRLYNYALPPGEIEELYTAGRENANVPQLRALPVEIDGGVLSW